MLAHVQESSSFQLGTILRRSNICAIMMFADSIVWVGSAVERFRLMDLAHVQTLLVPSQKGTTLWNEDPTLIAGIS